MTRTVSGSRAALPKDDGISTAAAAAAASLTSVLSNGEIRGVLASNVILCIPGFFVELTRRNVNFCLSVLK